jgi:hypothetical protein
MTFGMGAEPGHHEHRSPSTRLQRMTVDRADIERTDCAAAGAVNVEPRPYQITNQQLLAERPGDFAIR